MRLVVLQLHQMLHNSGVVSTGLDAGGFAKLRMSGQKQAHQAGKEAGAVGSNEYGRRLSLVGMW